MHNLVFEEHDHTSTDEKTLRSALVSSKQASCRLILRRTYFCIDPGFDYTAGVKAIEERFGQQLREHGVTPR